MHGMLALPFFVIHFLLLTVASKGEKVNSMHPVRSTYHAMYKLWYYSSSWRCHMPKL